MPEKRWSIGIVTGDSPLLLTEDPSHPNPRFTWRDIPAPHTTFVADPFLVRENGRWYLFFESFNTERNKGEVGVAESDDLINWKFITTALSEPFHLSYPFVFKVGKHYYMIPETKESGEVRLYKAVDFPRSWKFEKALLHGEYVDSSPIWHNGHWYLFTCRSPYTGALFYAPSLHGPWKEHPKSPLSIDAPASARPGGRPLHYRGKILRFVQNNTGGYGKRVRAFVVDKLSPKTFHESPVSNAAGLFEPHGAHWAWNGMHHLAPVKLPNGRWVATVDGNGDGSPD